MGEKILALNRRARHDYQIIDEYTAGIMLKGFEVKSIRNSQADIKNAFVTLKNGEAWLTNAHVKQYSHAGSLKDYDPTRPRKLLLNQRELDSLVQAKENKLTIIPLKIIVSGRHIKLCIATARGKKSYDKRQDLKKHDADLAIKRALK